jgi:hypothetical protein
MSDIVTELNKVAAKVGGSTNANTIKDAISNISVGLGGDGSATDISDALSDVVQVASAGGSGNGSDKVPKGFMPAPAYDHLYSQTLGHFPLVDGDDYIEFVNGQVKSSGKITAVYPMMEAGDVITTYLGEYPPKNDTLYNSITYPELAYPDQLTARNLDDLSDKRVSVWISGRFIQAFKFIYKTDTADATKGTLTENEIEIRNNAYIRNPEDFVGCRAEIISIYGEDIEDNVKRMDHIDLGTFSYESSDGTETYHFGNGITASQKVTTSSSGLILGSGRGTVTINQEIHNILYSKELMHGYENVWMVFIKTR